jgi:uncharacterized protein YrrD
MSRVADLHVGSAVYSSQGEKVGRLRFIMVDPDTESVSHLVLEKGMMLSQDVLAPVNTVQQLLYRGIFLTLSAAEVRQLPEFNEARYIQRDRMLGNSGEGRQYSDRGDREGGQDSRGNNGHRRGRRFRRH